MEDIIHIEILVEDKSGGILLEEILKKYINDREGIYYRINSFKGIGRIPKKIDKVHKMKTNRLLTDLPIYLKGLNNSLRTLPYKTAVFVVVDNDDEDCVLLKRKLLEICNKLNLNIQIFFCIAIEEMEAWLLGDPEAIAKAYSSVKKQVLQSYSQDSICGTWEYLADAVYKGGFTRLKKEAASYEIGKQKCIWAKEIGTYLNIRNNKSPSFNYFISKLDLLCG